MSAKSAFDDVCLGLLSFLEAHDGVCHVRLADRVSSSPGAIAFWQKKNAPYLLPDDFKSFLLYSDGLSLRWDVKFKGKETPVGHMALNPLSGIVKIPLDSWPEDDKCEPKFDKVVQDSVTPLAAYDLDETCTAGRLVFLYHKGPSDPQVWFQDLSCNWNFVANTFSDYFRLIVLHLGVLNWQYAFTKVGLDLVTKQWLRFFCPERLAIDLKHHEDQHSGSLDKGPRLGPI